MRCENRALPACIQFVSGQIRDLLGVASLGTSGTDRLTGQSKMSVGFTSEIQVFSTSINPTFAMSDTRSCQSVA